MTKRDYWRKRDETPTEKERNSRQRRSLLPLLSNLLHLHLLLLLLTPFLRSSLNPLSLSWFILKQGKIFWFKSDQVTPVSVLLVFGGKGERKRERDRRTTPTLDSQPEAALLKKTHPFFRFSKQPQQPTNQTKTNSRTPPLAASSTSTAASPSRAPRTPSTGPTPSSSRRRTRRCSSSPTLTKRRRTGSTPWGGRS